MNWWKDANKKRMIIQRIQNICEVRSISPDDILTVAAAIADLAHAKGVDALSLLSDQQSKLKLLQENKALKQQVKILEDQNAEMADEIIKTMNLGG